MNFFKVLALILFGLLGLLLLIGQISESTRPASPKVTDEEYRKRGCKYLRSKPIAQLSTDDVHVLDYCRAVGY